MYIEKKIALTEMVSRWCEALGIGGAVFTYFEKGAVDWPQIVSIAVMLVLAVYFKSKSVDLKRATDKEGE